MNITYFAWQLKAIINPFSQRHMNVNLAYMVNTFVVFVLIYRSYKALSLNVYISCIIMMVRQGIRILDLE